MTAVQIALAGALGAALRYLVERAVSARVRREWPWGTFVVNVTGCLALGLLADAHPVLAVGLIGAYTTFSAYAVEVVKTERAAAYALGSLGCGVLAAALGLALARL